MWEAESKISTNMRNCLGRLTVVCGTVCPVLSCVQIFPSETGQDRRQLLLRSEPLIILLVLSMRNVDTIDSFQILEIATTDILRTNQA
jgi:hypothetical protein